MYAMGQRVAKTLDGSRPGYRGDDAARSSEGTSAGRADPGAGAGYGDGPSSSDRDTNTRENNSPQATGNSPPLQRATNLDVKEQYAVGTPTTLGTSITPAATSPHLENIRNDNTQMLQNFINYERPVPTYGLMKFFEKPLQTFSNFNASINRPFFEKVIRAGKIPGLNFGTVTKMTPKQLEDAYQSYMSNRLSGATDAYGNPIGGGGNDGGGGIMDIYNLVNATDTDTDTDTDTETEKFVSRFLQNRTPEERAELEEQYQNYYTV
jgi:hypothetical protein